MEILNLQREKFIKECREYLRTKKISDTLNNIVLSSTPAEVDNIIKYFRETDKQLLETVLVEVRMASQSKLSVFINQVNALFEITINGLETRDAKYIVSAVQSRYSDDTNPVEAIYFDIQEVMMFSNEVNDKHYEFVIKYFKDPEVAGEYVYAIETDVDLLEQCQHEITVLKTEYKITLPQDSEKKLREIHYEMNQWKSLISNFPEWTDENSFDEPEDDDDDGVFKKILGIFCVKAC